MAEKGVAGAWRKSSDALRRSAGEPFSKFLSDTNPDVLIICHDAFRDNNPFFIREPLIREPNWVQDAMLRLFEERNWGQDAMFLSLSDAAPRKKHVEYLRAAANFSGSLYLHNIFLHEEEASEWWDALSSSLTPPKQLTLSSAFYHHSATRPGLLWNSGVKLLDAVNMNGKMEEVRVSKSDLQFIEFSKPICLKSFVLFDVQVHDKFVDQLAQGGYGSITSLTLGSLKPFTFYSMKVACGGRRWQPSFAKFLEGNLKRLTLAGFSGLQGSHLISFMKALEHNDCLEHLGLSGCSGFRATTDVVGAVVDALHKSGLQHLDVSNTGLQRNMAIKAQLGRNQTLKSYEKVPATSARLLICGDPYAGKTTLLRSLVAAVRSTDFLHRVKARYAFRRDKFLRANLERTRGIKVRELARDGIRVSVWDMAGQAEFHAFHELMFPDPSAQGSPALFMFVWSPIDSKDSGMGNRKAGNAFEASFWYWLKFITSKSRLSNVTHKVIIVLTRQDRMDLIHHSIATSLAVLKNTFQKIVEVVDVCEVDARNPASVQVVASSVFQVAMDVLKDFQVYKVCDEVNKYLTSSDFNPILSWEDFQTLCRSQFGVEEAEVQRAIASSLHESGHLIYLHSMPFLIIDTNWFCHEVMGDLIHFSGPHASVRTMPNDGFIPQHYLEKLLEKSTASRIKGAQLVDLMESMRLCCKVPNDAHSRIFIPTTLSNSKIPRILGWRRGMVEHGDAKIFYVGRRLQCRDKEITFLTPGLFPVIQVCFNKAFCEIGADVVLDKDFISIWYQGMEIIVEFCEALGEHVMDVLVRWSEAVDQSAVLKLVEEKVIRTLITLCAQSAGNQGVELVHGIIRLDCLKTPAPSHERADQCVLTEHLKEHLRQQLQERPQHSRFWHTWKHNTYFEVGTDSILDLLGFEEYWEVIKSYESTLEEVTEELALQEGIELRIPVHGELGEMPENIAQSPMAPGCSRGSRECLDGQAMMDVEGLGIPSMDTICQGMASCILQEVRDGNSKMVTKLDGLGTKLDGFGTKLDVMHKDLQRITTLQSRVLPHVQRMVEQFWCFAREKEAGRTPRLCFLTTGVERRLITALFKDVKNVRIELFCEHREGPHRVDNQEGLCVTTLSDGAINKAIPYVNGFLKVLNLAAKVGAHVVAGAGSSVPDFSKIVALMLDSPSLLDIIQSGLPNIEAATTTASAEPGFMASFVGWQEWLVSVLEHNGGFTDHNIATKFKMRRALYLDTYQVAWLCDAHYKSKSPFPLL